jgi:hypothetical protein
MRRASQKTGDCEARHNATQRGHPGLYEQSHCVDTNKLALRELTAFVAGVTVPRGKFYL